MDELVLFIAKSLVDKPDAVKVEMHEDDDAFVIELSVDPSDVGKVIGKQGRIAKGSGTTVQEVNRLMNQFNQSRQLMKQMTNKKFMKRASRGFPFGF